MILSSGKLFSHPHYYICMFQGNLNGLKVGAPVKVKGVQNRHSAVNRFEADTRRGQAHPSAGSSRRKNGGHPGSPTVWAFPVIFQLDERELKSKGATGAALDPKECENLIYSQGLRAQLNMESLPDRATLHRSQLPSRNSRFRLFIQPGSGPYPEIPTIPTDLEQIRVEATRALAKIEKVDLNKLVNSITDAGISVNLLASNASSIRQSPRSTTSLATPR